MAVARARPNRTQYILHYIQKESNMTTPATRGTTRESDRCAMCSTKLRLLGFRCRCGACFCAAHRHGDAHRCSFDYAASERARIAADNPKIVHPKLEPI